MRSLIIAISLLASKADPPVAPADLACEVSITGGMTKTFQATSSRQSSTRSEGTMPLWFAGRTGVGADMATQPSAFNLQCRDVETAISFTPAAKTEIKDIPVRPKTYRLVGTHMKDAKPGDVVAVGMTSGLRAIVPTEPGEFVITRYDKAAVAGTFHFKGTISEMNGKSLPVEVSGKFNFKNRVDK